MLHVMHPAVSIKALTVAYGDRLAIDHLNLTVPRGTVTAVLGPNGAGTTTLVRTLATLVTPTSGRATVAGYDVVHAGDRVRERIGLSGQYSALDADLTVVENLELVGRLVGVDNPTDRAAHLSDQLRLADIADRRVGQLSGGNQRRADLALSLVGEPEVLFLDEPTTGLDPRARLALWSAVPDLARSGTSVLLTTQYLDEADHLADRILVLDAGRAVAEGTPSELKAQLGCHQLTVATADRDDLDRLGHLAGTHPSVLRTIGGPGDLTITVDEPAGAVDLISRIAEADLAIADLQILTPTLDDVFRMMSSGRIHLIRSRPSTSIDSQKRLASRPTNGTTSTNVSNPMPNFPSSVTVPLRERNPRPPSPMTSTLPTSTSRDGAHCANRLDH